ncbi:hypothetical protein [Niabella hibiscisoli]|uniref:hypothetical protein n=1 Tax=Niabella hibiscisoli TaxID=1825928 RepID=UPI001F117BAA|nr:hypothetical protein [Niabella hibiscisoli]MCH5718144.1 hypothetical protein [Niabella hibiscisoli]
MQWFLNQQDTAGYNYVNKAKQYLLSWAAVNNPTSHTPNETAMLDFLKAILLSGSKLTHIAEVSSMPGLQTGLTTLRRFPFEPITGRQ